MKKILLIITAVLALASCAEKPKEIPPLVLEDMLADIVLTDSYVSSVVKPTRRAKDTIDYFTPIFKKYGYTIEDLDYTIDKMSRRKTDAVWSTLDNTVGKISSIQQKYERNNNQRLEWKKFVEEQNLDTLYYYPDTIFVRKKADLEQLIHSFPVTQKGTFTFTFDYISGKDDENNARYIILFQKDTIDKSDNAIRQAYWISKTRENEQRLTKRTLNIRNLYKTNLVETHLLDHRNLSPASDDYKYKKMNTKLFNILVTFTPDADYVALETFYKEYPLPFMLDIERPYRENFERPLLTPFTLEALGIPEPEAENNMEIISVSGDTEIKEEAETEVIISDSIR